MIKDRKIYCCFLILLVFNPVFINLSSIRSNKESSINFSNQISSSSNSSYWLNDSLEFRKKIYLSLDSSELNPIFEWNLSLNDLLAEQNILGQANEYSFDLVQTNVDGEYLQSIPFELIYLNHSVFLDPSLDSNSDGLSDDFAVMGCSKKNSIGDSISTVLNQDYGFYITPNFHSNEKSQSVWINWTETMQDENPQYEGDESVFLGKDNTNILLNENSYLDFWYKIENIDARLYFSYTYELSNQVNISNNGYYNGWHIFKFYNGGKVGQWIHFRKNLYNIIKNNGFYENDPDKFKPNRPHDIDSVIRLKNFKFHLYDYPNTINTGYSVASFSPVAFFNNTLTLRWQYPGLMLDTTDYYFQLYFSKKDTIDTIYYDRNQNLTGTNYIIPNNFEIKTSEWNGEGHSFLHLNDSQFNLWSAPSSYKIYKDQCAPVSMREYIKIAAAKNEVESFQLIINAKTDLSNINIYFRDFELFESDALIGDESISSNSFRRNLVDWVNITIPTYFQGEVGFWPDPLPNFTTFELTTGQCQPIWISVRPPENVKAGIYAGDIILSSSSFIKEIPVRLEVFDFILNNDTNLRSAWQINIWETRKYHAVSSEPDIQQVVDQYNHFFKYLRIEPQNNYDTYSIPVEFHDSQLSISNGYYTLRVHYDTPDIFEIYMDDLYLGRFCTHITQYENGYGYPSIDHIKSYKINSGPIITSGTITAIKNETSSVHNRKFEIEFSFRFIANTPFFQVRTTRIKNIDTFTYNITSYSMKTHPELDQNSGNDVANNFVLPPEQYSFWYDPTGYIGAIENSSSDYYFNYYYSGGYHSDAWRTLNNYTLSPNEEYLSPNDPFLTIIGNNTSNLADIESQFLKSFNHLKNPLQINIGSVHTNHNYYYNNTIWTHYYPISLTETAGITRNDALVQIKLNNFSDLNLSSINLNATRLVNPNAMADNNIAESGGHYSIFQIDDSDFSGDITLNDCLYFQTNLNSLDNITYFLYFSEDNAIEMPDYSSESPMMYREDLLPHAEIDFSKFEEWGKKYLDELNFQSFRLPIDPIYSKWERIWETIDDYPVFSIGFNSSFISYIKEICLKLRENGWLDKAYYYIHDEPKIFQYINITKAAELVRQADPDLKILTTEQPEQAIEDAVDIWVPLTYRHDVAKAKEQVELGKESWWYCCAEPQSPYANYFIDEFGINHRMWFWSTYIHNITGVLYWGVNFYSHNPWDGPITESTIINNKYIANGDGYLFYPPDKNGIPGTPMICPPISSQRAELIREGIEDYDYFYLLRNLYSEVKKLNNSKYENLLSVTAQIFEDLWDMAGDITDFEQDIKEILEFRLETAHLIGKLWRIQFPESVPKDYPKNYPIQYFILSFCIPCITTCIITISLFKLIKRIRTRKSKLKLI